MSSPNSTNFPVAPKVKWGAIWAAILGVLLAGIPSILGDGELVAGIPDWVTVILAGLVPAAGSAGAGYSAKHQVRRTDTGVQPGTAG